MLGWQTVPEFRSSDLENRHRNPSESEGPHRWRCQINGADGGRHPIQADNYRTSSETLNHAATCIRAQPT